MIYWIRALFRTRPTRIVINIFSQVTHCSIDSKSHLTATKWNGAYSITKPFTNYIIDKVLIEHLERHTMMSKNTWWRTRTQWIIFWTSSLKRTVQMNRFIEMSLSHHHCVCLKSKSKLFTLRSQCKSREWVVLHKTIEHMAIPRIYYSFPFICIF